MILGPAHPLRGGGITTFNQRLAREFQQPGYDCSIYSFSLQYPSFLFPGKTQYSDEPAPKDLVIHSAINSVNPLNWINVGNRIKKERPDLVIVRFWLPFMGPSLGTILRRIKKNGHTKVICIADNVIPHEKRPGDKWFTRYFLNACDAFVTMSEKVMNDLRLFENKKPAVLTSHPLYDNFGPLIPKDEARRHLGLPETGKLILFFGFIRKYKGLDLLLEAMHLIKENPGSEKLSGLKLMIAGEFYEDKKTYDNLIEKWNLQDCLVMKTDFIPDRDVAYYLCAADAVIQPYRHATQSGVTPLAFHFEKPMIVTKVGGLADMVPDREAGLTVEPNAESIANGIREFYNLGEAHFIPHLRREKQKYSWQKMVDMIFKLAEEIG